MTSETIEREREALAKHASHAADSRRFLSDHTTIERTVCAAFLRSLGLRFAVGELRPVDPRERFPDVLFRDAKFEVSELLDAGRRRDAEWKERVIRYGSAETLAAAAEPLVPATKLTYEQLVTLVTDALKKKLEHYGGRTCSGIDALVYVNRRAILDIDSAPPSQPALDALAAQRWRSVSVFSWPYGYVLLAVDSAPEWLRSFVLQTRDEWVRGDPSRGDTIFEVCDADSPTRA